MKTTNVKNMNENSYDWPSCCMFAPAMLLCFWLPEQSKALFFGFLSKGRTSTWSRPTSKFTFLQRQILHVLGHNGTAAIFPFGAITDCVIKALIGGDTENVAIAQLLRQGDDVIVKKFEFAFVPKVGRVGGTATVTVR